MEAVGDEEHHGTIASMPPGVDFGFIADVFGHRWFFHKNSVTERKMWPTLSEGTRVTFKEGHNKVGKCAVHVERMPTKPASAI